MATSDNDLIYTLCNFNRTLEKYQISIEPLLKTGQQSIIFNPHVCNIFYEVNQWKSRVKCVAYTGNVDINERDQIRAQFEKGEIKFLYATPRMYFDNSYFRNFVDKQVKEGKLAYIVFDDAKFLFEYDHDSEEYKSYLSVIELKTKQRDQKWIVIADAECQDKLTRLAGTLQLQNAMVMKIEYEEKNARHVYEYSIDETIKNK